MKISDTKNSHTTNSPGESHDFEIGDTGMIIEILRNRLYRHPVRTLVQEYISNGRDAVREANLPDHKLIVKAPTKSDPTFSVRDFGSGISPERMKNVFVKYGASTKRDSNKQVGGFGIGAKSAWAYADSFTIITRIDGVQRQYLAHIGSKNQGVLEFIGESKTTEENGTEIIVPVKSQDIPTFHTAIQRCVFFWETRPTLINLQEDAWFNEKPCVNQNGITIFYDFKCHDYKAFETDRYLVVDGIPYEANTFEVRSVEVKNCFVGIHCKTGDVEVSASREGLSDTPSNRKTIEKLTADSNTKIAKIRSNDCANSPDAKTYLSRLAFWCRITEIVSDIKPKFDISLDANFYLCFKGTPMKGTKWRFEGSKLKTYSERSVCFEDLKEIPLFVHLDKPMSPTSYTLRVRQTLKNAGKKVAFGFKDLTSEITDLKVSQIKLVRNPTTRVANRTPVQVYNLQRYNGYSFHSNEVDFSNLGNNNYQYIYVDLNGDKEIINRYYEVAKISNRLLVGVGAKAKKAIEEAKNKHPRKFFTPDEIKKDPEEFFGGDFNRIARLAQKSKAVRAKSKSLRLCLNFIELKGLTKALDSIDDPVFRDNFLNIATVFKKTSKYEYYSLPDDLIEKILAGKDEFHKEIELAQLLGDLIYAKIPFFEFMDEDRCDDAHTKALVQSLNFMINAEIKK